MKELRFDWTWNQPNLARLLFAAMLFALVQETVNGSFQFVFRVFAPPTSNVDSVLSFFQSLDFWNDITSFSLLAISLLVFYRLGRRIKLAKEFLPVSISLFVGGIVGGTIGFSVLPPMIFDAVCALGTSVRCITTGNSFDRIASTIPFGPFGPFFLVSLGLGMLFRAIFAIALASIRNSK